MDKRALLIATAGGLALQLTMVAAGHYVAFVKDNLFAVAGLLISLGAGLAYARMARGGWPGALGGGVVSGGVCALIGIAVSLALGDTPAAVVAFGTVGSMAAGALGGALGKLATR